MTRAATTWRPVAGWEDLYQVSDMGQVFSLRRNKHLTPYLASGYQLVTLTRNGKTAHRLIHQLVTEAFIGPCPAGQQVRHGPGGNQDNRLTNLNYGTPIENCADRRRDGTHPAGSRNGFAKLTESIVTECRRRSRAGETYKVLAAEFGVDQSTIGYAVTGKTWRHLGVPS